MVGIRSNMWFRPLLLLATWAGITVVGAALHRASDARPMSAEPLSSPAMTLQRMGNLAEVAAIPGTMAVRVAAGAEARRSLGGVASAHGLAWAAYLVAALSVRFAARRFTQERAERAAADEAARVDHSRRRFAITGGVAVLGVGGGAASAYATLVEPWLLAVRRRRIAIRDLPGALEGLRLVQVSDTHFGSRVPSDLIREAVAQTVGLKPDLVLLTGDYIHHRADEVGPAAELLAPLVSAAPLGAIGVLGNHDWWGDGPGMRRALESVGVRMLDNRRMFLCARTRALLANEPTGESLCIAGVGDLEEDAVDLRAALSGVRGSTPRLLLSHNPDVAEHPEFSRLCPGGAHRVDLMLSGHTHGGQVNLPLVGPLVVPSRYGQKYAGGLVAGPAFPVLVSRGVGMSLIPVRINCPPEIVQVILVRA